MSVIVKREMAMEVGMILLDEIRGVERNQRANHSTPVDDVKCLALAPLLNFLFFPFE